MTKKKLTLTKTCHRNCEIAVCILLPCCLYIRPKNITDQRSHPLTCRCYWNIVIQSTVGRRTIRFRHPNQKGIEGEQTRTKAEKGLLAKLMAFKTTRNNSNRQVICSLLSTVELRSKGPGRKGIPPIKEIFLGPISYFPISILAIEKFQSIEKN